MAGWTIPPLTMGAARGKNPFVAQQELCYYLAIPSPRDSAWPWFQDAGLVVVISPVKDCGAYMAQRGFSLIELLIVVAIILVIMGIAIPNFLHSRIAANEASAVYSIRTVNTAQTTYATTYPEKGYASSLSMLAAPIGGGQTSSANAGVLDWVLGCSTSVCAKSGYNFQIVNVSGSPVVTSYGVTGTPIQVAVSGYRGFCSDNMNPVKVDPSGGTNCTQDLQ
jgi:type IV pilus assembly protein PilA